MRKIVVGIIAIAVWSGAMVYYFQYRAENQKELAKEQRRAELRKPPPPPPPPVFGPGRGEFETYFKEKSPLSNKPEMMRRLAIREGSPPATLPGQPPAPGYVEASGDDYDVSKEIFRIYVPEKYDAAQPHGIFYYLGYKDTVGMPADWKPKLDRLHLIFIGPRNVRQPDWQQAAMALDALHNLKRQYSIDEKRLYLCGFSPALVGNQMIFGLADQFTGFVSIYRPAYFRPTRVLGRNGAWAAQIAPPPADLLATARTKPYVFVTDPPPNPPEPNWVDRFGSLVATMKQDGFPRVLKIELNDKEEVHYPNFHGPWFEQMLEFFTAPP